jgi:MOSC domain-containing protein YiiM
MASVVSVSRSAAHGFSKPPQPAIRLLKGLGVEGDAHLGKTTQHLYLQKKNPALSNLCQVHLIHSELFGELSNKGFEVRPGDLGENITTCGLDLLALSTGTLLYLGDSAIVEVTGVRSPCVQIDKFQRGLMAATLDKDVNGNLIRKAGIMSIVIAGGDVKPGDTVRVEMPDGPHRPLEPV